MMKNGSQKRKNRKAKRRMLFAFVLLLTLIGVIFSSTINDWRQIYQNRAETMRLTSEYTELLQREERLRAEVTKFRDPNFLARYARERYLYSLPNELIIRLPNRWFENIIVAQK